jgi:hypothetical protein
MNNIYNYKTLDLAYHTSESTRILYLGLKFDKQYFYEISFKISVTKQISTNKIIEPNWKRLAYMDEGSDHVILFELADALALVISSSDESKILGITMAMADAETLASYKKKLEDAAVDIDVKDNIQINFWYDSRHGPQNKSCELEVPSWEEIAMNYPLIMRNSLAELITLHPKDGLSTHGKLIILQGSAGVGKTYYIRALAKAWKNWCNFNYIIDTDQFFSAEGASYMMRVLTEFDDANEDNNYAESVSYDNSPAVLGLQMGISRSSKYNLLIIEDAGELISIDAKLQTGQALARLLNVTDGLMGQGIKLFVLITTNENLESLNTAVSRPGRCLAKIAFDKFSISEANTWLENNKLPPVDKPVSLAELCSMRDKNELVLGNNKNINPIGFSFKS